MIAHLFIYANVLLNKIKVFFGAILKKCESMDSISNLEKPDHFLASFKVKKEVL